MPKKRRSGAGEKEGDLANCRSEFMGGREAKRFQVAATTDMLDWE